MIISLLQEKGGSGKTTIAVNVARALTLRGYNVLLVDSDPQGSTRDWHTKNGGLKLDVIGLDRPTIDRDIKQFVRRYDIILIDGAPHLSTMIVKILLCSDVVLIPVQPSPYDVWASASLVSLVKQRQEVTEGKPKAGFIVSRQIVNTVIGREVRSVLNEYEMPVLQHGTFQRISYTQSAAKGETVLDTSDTIAINEVKNIADEILQFCGGMT